MSKKNLNTVLGHLLRSPFSEQHSNLSSSRPQMCGYTVRPYSCANCRMSGLQEHSRPCSHPLPLWMSTLHSIVCTSPRSCSCWQGSQRCQPCCLFKSPHCLQFVQELTQTTETLNKKYSVKHYISLNKFYLFLPRKGKG